MTHLDTFDPKSGTETGGPTQTIKTNADGVQLAEKSSLLANHADKIAVVKRNDFNKGYQQGNYFILYAQELPSFIEYGCMDDSPRRSF